MSEEITIREIVTKFLVDNNYDGLFNDDCACENSNLFPCSEVGMSCEAGVRVACDCGDHDFHIARRSHDKP